MAAREPDSDEPIQLIFGAGRRRLESLSPSHVGHRGVGETSDKREMAACCGFTHSAAVAQDGTLFVWGGGERGQLGLGDTANRSPSRLDRLAVPVEHALAFAMGTHDRLGAASAVRCLAGEKGLLKMILERIGSPVAVVSAGLHTMGIVTDAGDLLMCGWGESGKLGLGDEADRTTPTMVDRALFGHDAVLMVACGERHTAALTEGGVVFTCGRGLEGQLGHGDAENQRVPTRIPTAQFNNGRVVMLTAGKRHTVALSEEGHVFTWGHGGNGQLGQGSAEDLLSPRLLEPGRFGGEKMVFVAAGGDHTVAVTTGGLLYTWGFGEVGQLGHGDTSNRLVPTLVGAGALGGSTVVMAACGTVHTLVVTHDGALWACGRGDKGQLGLNDEEDRLAFERVGAGVFNAKIVTAAGGLYHSAAVTQDGALWMWGDGGQGRLGQSDVERRLVPALVATAGLRSVRIGRCRRLPEEHALAFAMGTHDRLGAAADAHCSGLASETGLVTMIASLSRLSWPKGAAGQVEGVVRLLGGCG